MIIFNEAYQTSVSKATGTYPAIITGVGQSNTLGQYNVYLYYYCPAITPTLQPKDHSNVILGMQSKVVAPKEAHEDAEYNYKIGDLITISFSDGNLNSPRFVRYQPLDENTRLRNQYLLEGKTTLLSESRIDFENAFFSDTIDELLTPTYTLLPYVQIASMGSENNPRCTFSITQKDKNSLPFIIFKCGKYGIEFVGEKTEERPTHVIVGGLTAEDPKFYNVVSEYNKNELISPEITFLDFIKVLYTQNYSGTIDRFSLCLREAFESTYVNEQYGEIYRSDLNLIAPNHNVYMAMMLGAICGYDNINNSLSIIAPGLDTDLNHSVIINNLYNSINGEQIYLFSPGQTATYYRLLFLTAVNFYISKTEDINTEWEGSVFDPDFRVNFWKSFENIFSDEIDRYIAIKLYNNQFRIKDTFRFGEYTDTQQVMAAILTIISVAYPCLEKALLENIGNTIDNGKIGTITIAARSEQLQQFFIDVNDIFNNANTTITRNNIKERSNIYALAMYGLFQSVNDKNTNQNSGQILYNGGQYTANIQINIVSNIETMINNLCETLSVAITPDNEIVRDDYVNDPNIVDNDSAFGITLNTYPVKETVSITSPFGPRWGSFHLGVDFVAPYGTEIISVSSGIIVETGDSNDGKGNHINILYEFVDSDGTNRKIIFSYMHLSSINYFSGTAVKAGDVIGKSGYSGTVVPPNINGSHLHFEIIDITDEKHQYRRNPLTLYSKDWGDYEYPQSTQYQNIDENYNVWHGYIDYGVSYNPG